MVQDRTKSKSCANVPFEKFSITYTKDDKTLVILKKIVLLQPYTRTKNTTYYMARKFNMVTLKFRAIVT